MIIRNYNIKSNGPRLRIVVAADFHNTDMHADIVADQHPDLILVPGDLCYHHVIRDGCHPDEFFIPHWKHYIREHPDKIPKPVIPYGRRFLEELAEIAPTYMSIGNHECLWKKADRDTARKTGATLLWNTFTLFETCDDVPIYIGGLSSVGSRSPKPVKTDWLQRFSSVEGYKILMAHEPQFFPKYVAETSIDLTVSGHAHGGQWRIFGQGVFAPDQGFFPKYTRGKYFDGRLVVSAGMANTVKAPRIFNPCELVIIDLAPDC